MKKTILIFLLAGMMLCSVGDNLLSQKKKNTADLLWDHLQRRSIVWFEKYIAENRDPALMSEWKSPLDRAFMKLINASLHQPINITYTIVNNPAFNAMAFPGGQFAVHSGCLTVLEQNAVHKMASDKEMGKKRGIDYYREREAAPVIAHELGHFYSRHTYRSIMLQQSFTDTGTIKFIFFLIFLGKSSVHLQVKGHS